MLPSTIVFTKFTNNVLRVDMVRIVQKSIYHEAEKNLS